MVSHKGSSKHASVENATWNSGFKRNGFILKELVTKDFKLKYRRSVLGVLWSVLNPLLMMIVMAIVFTHMMRGGSSDKFPAVLFPLYLIIGNVTFAFMNDSTTQGMTSIIAAAPLLKKVKIQRNVFPIEKALFALVNFGFSCIAILLVMIFFQVMPTWNFIFIPLFLVYLTLFCIGLSLFLSTLAVFFRDIIHLWSVVIIAWTYLTPIFYYPSLLPGWLQNLEKFNPMYQFIEYFRSILLYQTTPSLQHNLICLACGLVSLGIGYLVFKKNESKFILFI